MCVFFPANVLTGCRQAVLCLWSLWSKQINPQHTGDLLKEVMQVEGLAESEPGSASLWQVMGRGGQVRQLPHPSCG